MGLKCTGGYRLASCNACTTFWFINRPHYHTSWLMLLIIITCKFTTSETYLCRRTDSRRIIDSPCTQTTSTGKRTWRWVYSTWQQQRRWCSSRQEVIETYQVTTHCCHYNIFILGFSCIIDCESAVDGRWSHNCDVAFSYHHHHVYLLPYILAYKPTIFGSVLTFKLWGSAYMRVMPHNQSRQCMTAICQWRLLCVCCTWRGPLVGH